MYALIHNNQIQVGPRQWSWSFFKDYLDEQDLDASLLTKDEPEEPIITDTWKILPVEHIAVPSYDMMFEQLAGPFLTIGDTSVTGYFDVVPESINIAKNKMKGIVTNNRYVREMSGVEYTFSDGNKILVSTTRENRSIYNQTYQGMADGEIISFKFSPNAFQQVTKLELSEIIANINALVQSAFSWEYDKYAEIDSANTIDDLKTIQLYDPAWVDQDASIIN